MWGARTWTGVLYRNNIWILQLSHLSSPLLLSCIDCSSLGSTFAFSLVTSVIFIYLHIHPKIPFLPLLQNLSEHRGDKSSLVSNMPSLSFWSGGMPLTICIYLGNMISDTIQGQSLGWCLIHCSALMLDWHASQVWWFWLGIIPLWFQQGAPCWSNCHFFHLMTSLHLECFVI